MSPSLCCTLCYLRREEGGVFRFSLPLQDLVNVELQPEIYFRCVCDLIKRTVEPQPEIYFRCVLF